MSVSQINGLAADGYTGHQVSVIDLGGGVKALAVTGSGGVFPVTITLKAAPTVIGKSKIITVTNLLAVAITVQGVACGVVTVVENTTNPLTDFYIMRPTSADDREIMAAGRSFAFTAPFGTQWQTGQTVGYILNVSVGSADFIQDENA